MTDSPSQKLVRGSESLRDTIDVLRNMVDVGQGSHTHKRSHAGCHRKLRCCGEFLKSVLIMIGMVMSVLSASNTPSSHNVMPLECGGNLTCKWDYVQSEVDKVC